ncbi:MAG: hydroxyacylglutathione hydrolase [Methanomassiliicoccales archaeon PtaU1.Bin124]|nr:MAG: hydroxyacylglutathione hydrolase [Methanomassiliicoccales archaeon PtaU1.Bin124]
MKLLPNVYMVDSPTGANCYLICGEGETTMIDVGMGRNAPKVSALLREADVPVGGLRNIVITHAHHDHFQAAPFVKKAEGGRLMVHELDADHVAGKKAMPKHHGGMRVVFWLISPMLKVTPVDVDGTLKEGDVIDALGGLQVLHLPGHTVGNISLYSPSRKVLFCGDTVGNRNDELDVPFQYKFSREECDRSFERLAKLDVEALLPGHGSPIIHDANEAIRKFAAEHVKK